MDIDVANNIKAIEILKVELMQNFANLLGDIISDPEPDLTEKITSDIGNIISIAYLLGKRLGIPSSRINTDICHKLRNSIESKHNLEKTFGDLSELLEIFAEDKRDGESNV